MLLLCSIVFTNKNGMDRFNPSPPIKNKENEPPIKTKVKGHHVDCTGLLAAVRE